MTSKSTAAPPTPKGRLACDIIRSLVASQMKKNGTIYTRSRKKRKLHHKISKGYGIHLFLLVFILLILLTSINKHVAGFENQDNKSVFSRLIEHVISPTLTPTLTPTPTNTPTPTPTPVILPSRLIIDKLGIDTEIEYVGVDENDKMENPSGWDQVGWFGPGAPPGAPGNAVIAGHFDTDRGKPAVFFRLADLEPGDIIKVLTIFGEMLTFQVTGKEIYPYDQAPLDYIFSQSEIPRLILVTCEGLFNRSIKTYSHRIAVFSEQI